MNRRKFIEKSSLLSALALLPLSSCSSESKYRMGYQLYSIRDEMANAPMATISALMEMGYEDFETYGYEPERDSFYGIPAKELKMKLDDLGSRTPSGHFGFSPYLNKSDDELRRFVDQCIVGANSMGMSYITWPWIAPEQRTMDNFKLMGKRLNVIGEQVTKAGLGFAYHNHGFEFEDHNGENGFDIIMKDTDPSLVKLQMDMYWVMHSANFTPKELVKKYPGRIVMWHIKDMDKISRDYTELGNGSIDYTKELPSPADSGLEYYFLEQGGNYAISSLKSAADSAAYFRNNLKQRL